MGGGDGFRGIASGVPEVVGRGGRRRGGGAPPAARRGGPVERRLARARGRPPEERGRGARPRRGPDPARPAAEEVRGREAERGLAHPAARHEPRRRPQRDPGLPRAPLQGPGGDRRVLGREHVRGLRAVRLREGAGRAPGPRGEPRGPQRRGPVRDAPDPRRPPAPAAGPARGAPPRPRRLRHLRRRHEDAQRGGGDALREEHGARGAAAQRAEGLRAVERQAALPRRHPADALQHHPHRPADAAPTGAPP